MYDRMRIICGSNVFYRIDIPINSVADYDLVGQDLLFGSGQICAVYRHRNGNGIVFERAVVINAVAFEFRGIQLRIDDDYRKADVAFVDPQLPFDVAVDGARHVGAELIDGGRGKLQRHARDLVTVGVFEFVIQLIRQLFRQRHALQYVNRTAAHRYGCFAFARIHGGFRDMPVTYREGNHQRRAVDAHKRFDPVQYAVVGQRIAVFQPRYNAGIFHIAFVVSPYDVGIRPVICARTRTESYGDRGGEGNVVRIDIVFVERALIEQPFRGAESRGDRSRSDLSVGRFQLQFVIDTQQRIVGEIIERTR